MPSQPQAMVYFAKHSAPMAAAALASNPFSAVTGLGMTEGMSIYSLYHYSCFSTNLSTFSLNHLKLSVSTDLCRTSFCLFKTSPISIRVPAQLVDEKAALTSSAIFMILYSWNTFPPHQPSPLQEFQLQSLLIRLMIPPPNNHSCLPHTSFSVL